MPQAVVVIPARYGSTRLPGKPLTVVRGMVMIERVWRLACAAVGESSVYVATDDQRIIDVVHGFGGRALMTPVECRNGTERAHEAVNLLSETPEIVINMQGDAPLTPPWFVKQLIEAMREDVSCRFATPAVQISLAQYQQTLKSKQSDPFSGTFVTFDRQRNALYFSKQIIPALRSVSESKIPVYQHIGIYGYRYEALKQYLSLEEGVLEKVEGLEQLRILEHGLKIKVVPVDYRGRTSWAIDSPADIKRVESIIDQEGELLAS